MENQLARERNLESPPLQVSQQAGVPGHQASSLVLSEADGVLFQLPDDARPNRYIRPYLVSDDSTLYYSLMTPLQVSGCPRTPLLQVDPENVRAPFHGVGQDSLMSRSGKSCARWKCSWF